MQEHCPGEAGLPSSVFQAISEMSLVHVLLIKVPNLYLSSVGIYLEGNNAVSIRKVWSQCMPHFIALALLLYSQPLNFSAHPRITEPQRIILMGILLLLFSSPTTCILICKVDLDGDYWWTVVPEWCPFWKTDFPSVNNQRAYKFTKLTWTETTDGQSSQNVLSGKLIFLQSWII